MKSLVIVESPTKARTLAPVLGPDYIVMASMGHVRDLPDDALGVDVEDDFKPSYVVLKKKSKTLKALRESLKESQILYLATDPDREGEAIAWHLLQTLKPRNKPVQRVTFHQLTTSAIIDAFAHPQNQLDINLVNAQQARRILDRLVGYQVSPLLWRTTKGKSAGRVQSVALRMVVDREREIRAFVPREYWSIHADLATPDDHTQHFLARLIQIGKLKVGLDQPIHLDNQNDTDQLKTVLETATYRVRSVDHSQQQRKPWPPFTTSTMQQAASARLRLSPSDTMKTAQELYEGIDIGTGKTEGLITYMRTDSTAVAPEAQAAARDMITSTLGGQYLPSSTPQYKTKVKNAQEAHEAIRPTDVFRYPSVTKAHLSERQFRLYDLIWRRFVASQMASAVYDITTVDIIALAETLSQIHLPGMPATDASPPSCIFRAVGRALRFDGFLRVWQENDEKNDDEDITQKLPELSAGQLLHLLELIARQHYTQPPQRYTEAALIKALEERGIGRPSTYASIMITLQSRDYLVSVKRLLHPTTLGEYTCDSLAAAFPEFMDYGFTAQVEDWLDDVSRGDIPWVKALHDFYSPFAVALSQAEGKMRSVQRPQPTAASQQNEVEDSNGTGSAEPGSRKRSYSKGKKRKGAVSQRRNKPVIVSGVHCPLCDAPMVQRTGPRGVFLGCSRYPKCKGTRNVEHQAQQHPDSTGAQ